MSTLIISFNYLHSAELTCLAICGSVPTLKPLYEQLFSRKKSTTLYMAPGQKSLSTRRPIQQVNSPPQSGFTNPPSSSLASAHIYDDERKGNAASFV